MKEHTISRAATNGRTATQISGSLSRRILVAEDEPFIRQLNMDVLIHAGYQVDAAENGAVAWDLLQQHRYDLLITDNEMPQVSGMELVRKLHDARIALPVMMVSGTMPTAELDRQPWLQTAARLPKPYAITEFLNMVEKVLHTTAHAERISAREPARAGAERPLRILVVDDEPDSRQFSLAALAGCGYEVEAVNDGAAGWDAIQAKSYDLVVTDNHMPRMTGLEMIAKLRAARMTFPVIMATGHLPSHEFARQPWLKPDATLERPFSNVDLLAVVKKVLHANAGA